VDRRHAIQTEIKYPTVDQQSTISANAWELFAAQHLYNSLRTERGSQDDEAIEGHVHCPRRRGWYPQFLIESSARAASFAALSISMLCVES
jgi:hypothetical protein